jgi:hypothetical protein
MTEKPGCTNALFGVLVAKLNQVPGDDQSNSTASELADAHVSLLPEIEQLQGSPSRASMERLLEILAQPWLPQAAQLQILLALQALAPESVPFIERSFFSTCERHLRILTLKAAARILAAKISGGYAGMSREALHVHETAIRFHLEGEEHQFQTCAGYKMALALFGHLRLATAS